MTTTADVPRLGSGLGYRRELHDEILRERSRIDFVEVLAEQFLGDDATLSAAVELAGAFPVVPHGVSLSVGSADGPDPDHLRAVRALCDAVDAPYFSEHLAMTRAPGIDLGHLAPLWFTERALRVVADNVGRVQDALGRPLVLENITYPFEIPHAEMTQGEFFHRLVDRTGCGLLLDVANVHINSENHGFDPVGHLDALPLHALVQIHLAGGYWADGTFVDGHCAPVHEGTWDLLDALVARVEVRASILEQDADFPDELTPLLNDVERARRAIGCAVPERSAG